MYCCFIGCNICKNIHKGAFWWKESKKVIIKLKITVCQQLLMIIMSKYIFDSTAISNIT